MDDTEIKRTLNDPEFQRTVFNNIMQTIIEPAIVRRQERGELPARLRLDAAQVLLFPDGRPIQVLVNEEVRAIAGVKWKDGIEVQVGSVVSTSQVESIVRLVPTEDTDPDCAYIILVRIENSWFYRFSFVYNRGLSLRHLVAARQFATVAKYALKHKYWSPFVDTLFSASELAVKALMLGYVPSLRSRKKHSAIHSEYNRFARLGNVEEEERSTFNTLSELRSGARYLNREINLTAKQAKQMLTIVENMIGSIEQRIGDQ